MKRFLQSPLLVICGALLVQAQSECPSSALVLPNCARDIPLGNWSSCLSAEEIQSDYVSLSWTPHPDIPPTKQRSYEIYWRRRMPNSPKEWKRTPRLQETLYDESADRLSYTFDGLVLDTMYEMRLCLSPTPSLPVSAPASPECGYCTLRFNSQSSGSTLALLNATMQMVSEDTLVLTCRAAGRPQPVIRWDARLSGNRAPLSTESDDYDITENVEGEDSVQSVLSYNPDEVEFSRPECFIENGIERLRVRNGDFETIQATTMTTEPDETAAGATIETPVWVIVLLVVLPALVLISVVAIVAPFLYVWRRKKMRREILAVKNLQPKESNDYSNSIQLKSHPSVQSESSVLYGPLETTLPKHMIIPNSDIKVSTVIGQGQFGVVYKGTLSRNGAQELVAVKTLKGIFATSSEIQSFTEEILILQQFNHPNVMSLIGVCLGAKKVRGGPSIILPFMSKGSLLNFLRKESDRLRPSEEADVTQIGAIEKNLVQICLQIAKGMEYLAAQRFVHRDLAARNCMIDQNDQIRVGDFGLTEDIYAKNYFRQGSNDGVKLPVKWMSPESLKLGVFSEKTDVWSYGVTCWEVFSCGEIPYAGLHPQEVLPLLEAGQRLTKPRNPACSDQVYSVILSCWEAAPEKRKTFKELRIKMEGLLSSMSDYLDLNILASAFNSDSADNSYVKANEIVGPEEGATPEITGEISLKEEGEYDEVAGDKMSDTSTSDQEGSMHSLV